MSTKPSASSPVVRTFAADLASADAGSITNTNTDVQKSPTKNAHQNTTTVPKIEVAGSISEADAARESNNATIITDTKQKRFRLLPSISAAVNEWTGDFTTKNKKKD
jgi:hypothetical protein